MNDTKLDIALELFRNFCLKDSDDFALAEALAYHTALEYLTTFLCEDEEYEEEDE